MKYDVELLENDLLVLVQAKLPDKLAEITAEKADAIVLEIPSASQYYNTTDDEAQVSNEKFFVHYGLIDGDPFSISAATAEANRYIFIIYLNELNQNPGILRKKLFRYIRAFKEIFEENFDRIQCVSDITIQSIIPTSFSWNENEISPSWKVGGIYIETAIAS